MLVVLDEVFVTELEFGLVFELLLLEFETLKPMTVRITITRSPKGIATQTIGLVFCFEATGVLDKGDAE